jgi:hypothetical protein
VKENHEWTYLCPQDYKSIGDYNHIVHKICATNKHKKNKSKEQSLEKDTNFIRP